MNDELMNDISQIDQLIENNRLPDAMKMLRKAANDYPDEGIVPYYLGRIAGKIHEDQLALDYFTTAINKGYESADIYFSIAFLQNESGLFNDAEKNFKRSLDLCIDKEKRWACLSSIALSYLNKKMFLKAEKMSGVLIKEYPNNYEGYHLHILCEVARENLDDAEAYMRSIPDGFKKHPRFLLDKISLYKEKGSKKELEELLDDEAIYEIIPQEVLREKIVSLSGTEFSEEKEKLIEKLASDYGDSDAIFSKMIIEFGRRNFNKSALLAGIVLEDENSSLTVKNLVALYFQIYSFYLLSGEKPSDELKNWIRKAGNECVAMAKMINFANAGDPIAEDIQSLLGRID